MAVTPFDPPYPKTHAIRNPHGFMFFYRSGVMANLRLCIFGLYGALQMLLLLLYYYY